MWRAACLVVLCLTSACAKPTAPAAIPQPPDYTREHASLADADALVRVGCLDCLERAFEEYTALGAVPPLAASATEGRTRTAALIALRRTELGMLDGGYSVHALGSAAFDLARVAAPGPVSLLAAPELPRVPRSEETANTLNAARLDASSNELSAYLWLTLACSPLPRPPVSTDDRLAAVGALKDTPLVLYKEASTCGLNPTTLEALLNGDARFQEIHYLLANHALNPATRPGPVVAIEPDLDRADHHFRLAYEWRPDWPGVTLPIAHLAMAVEDFPRALDFYEKSLSLLAGQADALLGRAKALTYLGRHDDAIAAADLLLANSRTAGDGRYWRAFNELQLDRNDEAWADIELASKLVTNVEVPKLAGIIAIRRKQLDVARQKLEEARDRHTRMRLSPPDCDIGFYLQTVLSDQRQWEAAGREALAATACFDSEAGRIAQDIARLESADVPEDRRARQIARREQQLRNAGRRRANALFNAAVAHFNLAKLDEARQLAEALVDDDIFGERAREIVSRSVPANR